jgi:nitrate reductase gamma subunit
MEQWLEWARGPIFRMCFVIMLLGLARVAILGAISSMSIILKSKKNGREVPWSEIIGATLKWFFPFKKGLEHRAAFSLTSMVFHVSIIIAPVFLGAHILLWDRGLGIRWTAISNTIADYLTMVAIVTGILLFLQRVVAKSSRAISRFQDYMLLLVIVALFATGYLAMHPSVNPFGYNGTMFIHVMSGNLIFLLVPFTKLSHVALFSSTQLVSELGWHLMPGAGQKVAVALGKEDEPI